MVERCVSVRELLWGEVVVFVSGKYNVPVCVKLCSPALLCLETVSPVWM